MTFILADSHKFINITWGMFSSKLIEEFFSIIPSHREDGPLVASS